MTVTASRGRRKTLLLAIASVTVLHLIVYRSTQSIRTLHSQHLSKRSTSYDGDHRIHDHSSTDAEEPSTDALIDWLHIYNQASPRDKPLVFAVMTLWLTFLFAFVGICASEFFCPNLSHIASRLGLSESVAGVTFLAFSNGSPDVFSTFSALKSNAGSLAIGELIGAASFIVSVVAGTMALITPFKVARHTFLRDVGFFTLAVLLTLAILFDSHIHLWEALLMVGLYVVYVGYVAIGGWWWSRRQEQKMRLRRAREEYDHQSGHNGNSEDQEIGQLLLVDDEDEQGQDTIAGGAEIEWERASDDDDEDNLIQLPVSGMSTPRSHISTSSSQLSSTDSIIRHHQRTSRSKSRALGATEPPPLLASPRLPRPHSHHSHSHSHTHFRSRSASLINPIASAPYSRPPPTPLSLQSSISSLSSPLANTNASATSSTSPGGGTGVGTGTGSSTRKTSARPSLLGAIEFRDFVNSLQQERNSSSHPHFLSVLGNSGSASTPSSPSASRNRGTRRHSHRRDETNHDRGASTKRPDHSRTSSTFSGLTTASTSTDDGEGSGWGTTPSLSQGGGYDNGRETSHEWNWHGWGTATAHGNGLDVDEVGVSGRRRASSSPGFRPEVHGGGGLRLGGQDDVLAEGILRKVQKHNRDTSGPNDLNKDQGGLDGEEENPWVKEPSLRVKKVPSIMLNGSDTLLLPSDSDRNTPSSSSSTTASSSSLTVRPTNASMMTPSTTGASPLSSSHLPPLSPSSGTFSLKLATQHSHGKRILLRAILSALFPSLTQFSSKSIIGKVTALMCAPALLVLNLTLPVAEEVTEDDVACHGGWEQEKEADRRIELEGNGVPKGIRLPDNDDTGSLLAPTRTEGDVASYEGESAAERVGKRLHSPAIPHPHSHHLANSALSASETLPVQAPSLIDVTSGLVSAIIDPEEPATSPWINHQPSSFSSTSSTPTPSHHFRMASTESDGTVNRVVSSSSESRGDGAPEAEDEEEETESLVLDKMECEAARKVTRGLTAVQCTLGPVFCAVALFADEVVWYEPVLALGIGLCFATLSWRFFHNPRHPGRVTLCFLGFGIAMVWILMIVNEVVGVLQTLGHIFGISDAILGLTIFAMGNSLGDLVANATVARMGYPSMAIAACFGGPMLNILLGVGLSGTYLIALSPTHEPIHVEMGRTLMVSGVGLFLILVASLIVVPWNGFRMTKRIGGLLIGAYTIVLTMNVITEIWW